MPCASRNVVSGLIPDHCEDKIALQQLFSVWRRDPHRVRRISVTDERKYAGISPLLMRFSILGLIQYLTFA